jgi:fused signal recognition particle receptor
MVSWEILVAAAAVALVVAAVVVLWRRRLRVGAQDAERGAKPVGDRLRDGLVATRRKLVDQLDTILGRPADSAGVLAEIEEALIGADVGVRTAGELVARVRERVGTSGDGNDVRTALRAEIEAALDAPPASPPSEHPWVVLVTGVNGVGKTTTIGKLAARHAAAGRRVLLVAGDTFRAAAADQLAIWAERTGAEIVRQAEGADASAVVFDGIKAACARRVDVVLVDTAGRLHTRSNLMEELKKVRRVMARELPGAPHETLLVLDATTGQNALSQARVFAEALGVTGVVLTKLDGTARGGVVIAVQREVGAPVRYVGVGEALEDLRPFDAREFVEALFEGQRSSRAEQTLTRDAARN